MDELDKKLLNLLQQNGRLSIKKLSEALFITAPAVSQRIKHLEETEQLLYYQATIDYEQAGLPIKAFIHLSIEPQQKASFYPFIQAIPNVLECDCVTGPYSKSFSLLPNHWTALSMTCKNSVEPTPKSFSRRQFPLEDINSENPKSALISHRQARFFYIQGSLVIDWHLQPSWSDIR